MIWIFFEYLKVAFSTIRVFMTFVGYAFCVPIRPIGMFVKDYFLPFIEQFRSVPVLGKVLRIILKLLTPLKEWVNPLQDPIIIPDVQQTVEHGWLWYGVIGLRSVILASLGAYWLLKSKAGDSIIEPLSPRLQALKDYFDKFETNSLSSSDFCLDDLTQVEPLLRSSSIELDTDVTQVSSLESIPRRELLVTSISDTGILRTVLETLGSML
jgi:hypothetical protein